MADIPKCPTCHSNISADSSKRAQGSAGVDSDGNPLPRWSDDPLLTQGGLSGDTFIGLDRSRKTHIEELQIARKQAEEDLGVEPITEFSKIGDHGYHVRKTHIIELRESIERLLDIVGSDLKEYFSLDADGNSVSPGPNDTVKTDWTDVQRGLSYLDKDAKEQKDFVLPSGEKRLAPTFPENTRIRAIHIEDLRRFIPAGWKEFWSVSPLGVAFSLPATYTGIFDETNIFINPQTKGWDHLNIRIISPSPVEFFEMDTYFPTEYEIHPSDGGAQYLLDGIDVYPHDMPKPDPDAPTETEPDRTWLVSAQTMQDDRIAYKQPYSLHAKRVYTVDKVWYYYDGSGAVIDYTNYQDVGTEWWGNSENESHAITQASAIAEIITEPYPNVTHKVAKAQSLKLTVAADMSSITTRKEKSAALLPDDTVVPCPTFHTTVAAIPLATASAHHIWQLLNNGSNEYMNPLIEGPSGSPGVFKARIIKLNKNSCLKYLLNISGTGNAVCNGYNQEQTNAYMLKGSEGHIDSNIERTLFYPYVVGEDQLSPYSVGDVDGTYTGGITVNPNRRDVTTVLVLKLGTKPLFIRCHFEPMQTHNVQTITAPYGGQTFHFLRPDYAYPEGYLNEIEIFIDSSLNQEHDVALNIDDLLTAFKSVTCISDGSPVNFVYTPHKIPGTNPDGSPAIVENPNATPAEFIRLSFYLSVNSTPTGVWPDIGPSNIQNLSWMQLGPDGEIRYDSSGQWYWYYLPTPVNQDFTVYNHLTPGSCTDGGSNTGQMFIDAIRIEGNNGGINDV